MSAGSSQSSQIHAVITSTVNATSGADENSPTHLADPLLQTLREAGADDPEYVDLIATIRNGFPSSLDILEPQIRHFWKLRSELWTDKGLVLYRHRIVIPDSQRTDILARLYSSHQSIDRTKRLARQTVYWPGMTSDVTNTVRSCTDCQEALPSLPKEPMEHDPPPSRPFEDVSVDMFSHAGNHYLVYVDRLSGWPTVDAAMGRDFTSSSVIRSIKRNFIDLGAPVRLRSDGGFSSSEFAEFLRNWNVRHVMSTPHYPQSNGHAEAAVKAVKSLFIKTAPSGRLDQDAFAKGILEWRNTPRSSGLSPAKIVFGSPLRSCVPAHRSTFAAKWKERMDQLDNFLRKDGRRVKELYDRQSHPLRPIAMGKHVRVQDHMSGKWDRCGIIVNIGKHRDYRIKFPSGRVFWRNRRFIREDTTTRPKTDTNDRTESTNVSKPTAESTTSLNSLSFANKETAKRHRVQFDDDPPPRRSEHHRRPPSRLDL